MYSKAVRFPAEVFLPSGRCSVKERALTALERASSLACAKKKIILIVISNDDSTLFLSNLSIPKVAFQNEIPLLWSFPNNLSRFCLLRAKRLKGVKISFAHTLIYISLHKCSRENIKRKLCRSN